MGKTMSTIRNQNCDVPWSYLNHDVLYLVMMRLGVVDFDAFSAVCKSWRSLALSNRKRFMASRLPMSIRIFPAPTSMFISPRAYKKTCCLEDSEGRKFKTIIPHTVGEEEFVGLTCGYLILFNKKTNDFWLVNPITKHQLYFPDLPSSALDYPFTGLRGILVFSPSISGWMFVMVQRWANQIQFSISGKGASNCVSSPSPIYEIHVFKGKIYTLNCSRKTRDGYQLCELRLNPHPKLVLLETKNFLKRSYDPHFVSSGENLYVVQFIPGCLYSRHKLDISELKWVCCETSEEYEFFCRLEQTVVCKPKWWADLWPKYGKYADTKNNRWKDNFYSHMLYFPHDCLNVNLIHDR